MMKAQSSGQDEKGMNGKYTADLDRCFELEEIRLR